MANLKIHWFKCNNIEPFVNTLSPPFYVNCLILKQVGRYSFLVSSPLVVAQKVNIGKSYHSKKGLSFSIHTLI